MIIESCSKEYHITLYSKYIKIIIARTRNFILQTFMSPKFDKTNYVHFT